MLLTPHIVRAHGDHRSRSAADLHRLAAESRPRRTAAADRAAAARGGRRAARAPAPAPGASRRARRRRHPGAGNPPVRGPARHDAGRAAGIVAGAWHGRGAARRPAAQRSLRRRLPVRSAAAGRAAAGPPPAPPTAPAAAAAARTEPTSPGIGSAQVLLSPPGTTFRVGGGPVHRADLDHECVAAVDGHADARPSIRRRLRVRAVQEGSFMRSGGADASFTQQVERQAASTSRSSRARRMRPARRAPACSRRCCSMRSRPGRATLTISGTATGPGRHADGPAVQAGDGDGAAMIVRCRVAATRSSNCWSSRRS